MRKTLSILTVLMLGAASYAGTVRSIYNDETISSGLFLNIGIYDSLDIPPLPTTVDITGGEISVLNVNDTSMVNISGGLVHDMMLMADSSATLTGGEIRLIYPNGNIINLYGSDFLKDDVGSSFRLSGIWGDRSPFQIQFARAEPTDDNIVLHEVPEPASLIFFGLSGVILRNRRKT